MHLVLLLAAILALSQHGRILAVGPAPAKVRGAGCRQVPVSVRHIIRPTFIRPDIHTTDEVMPEVGKTHTAFANFWNDFIRGLTNRTYEVRPYDVTNRHRTLELGADELGERLHDLHLASG